jgi:hypothetical protein
MDSGGCGTDYILLSFFQTLLQHTFPTNNLLNQCFNSKRFLFST